MLKHRQQEFIRFLNGEDRVGPAVFEKLARLRAVRMNPRPRHVGELFMTNNFIEV